MMRQASLRRLRRDRLAYDIARVAIASRIQEDHRTSPAYLFCEFRGELMNANDVNLRSQFSPDFFRRMPGNTVITAKWVSVGDHENTIGDFIPEAQERFTSSSTLPSGLSSWTLSAICPTACFSGKDFRDGEEANLHDGVHARSHAAFAGDFVTINHIEFGLLRDELLLHPARQVVPGFVFTERAVK